MIQSKKDSKNGHPKGMKDRTKGLGDRKHISASMRSHVARIRRALTVHRIYPLVAVHVFILTVAYRLAYHVRFLPPVPETMISLFWQTAPWVILIKLYAFHHFGSFHGWWRHVTFVDLVSLVRVASMSTLVIAFADYFVFSQYQIPRAVLAVDWGVTILLLGGCRSVWRFGREDLFSMFRRKTTYRPAFLVVADRGAEEIVRQIHGNAKLDYKIVGFIDKNKRNMGTTLAGVPFIGIPEHAVSLAAMHNVNDILVMADGLSGKRLSNLMSWCRQSEIDIKMIPAVDQFLNGEYQPQVRDVAINDLLRRDQVELDSSPVREMLTGRRVVVTGAGGSIGSEVCRQILTCKPECLILIELSENSLFQIEMELRNQNSSSQIVACVANILDRKRVDSIFQAYRPELVFHAAAHKHVPLMEENAGEALKNNVFGTKTLCEVADAHQVERFVLISTDKAVNPTSVMGVTKQLAERFVRSLGTRSATKFVVVRFGNVLASAGSVIPTFQRQIREGGPITVTHPDMQRYFMTIPEASQLVLQAAAMGDGGETFVLDMGEQVKVIDVARDLIRLSGLSLEDIEIRITGVRPGEKLYEELTSEDETLTDTPHPKLQMAYCHAESREEIDELIEQIVPLLYDASSTVRSTLLRLIPSYDPNCGATRVVSAFPTGGEDDIAAIPVDVVGARSRPK